MIERRQNSVSSSYSGLSSRKERAERATHEELVEEPSPSRQRLPSSSSGSSGGLLREGESGQCIAGVSSDGWRRGEVRGREAEAGRKSETKAKRKRERKVLGVGPPNPLNARGRMLIDLKRLVLRRRVFRYVDVDKSASVAEKEGGKGV